MCSRRRLAWVHCFARLVLACGVKERPSAPSTLPLLPVLLLKNLARQMVYLPWS